MADNVTANSGSGGATFAADDIGGTHYPRTKLIHGADGVNDGDVSTANPLPIRTYFGTTAVTVGAGAVGTGVQRMTLASDDPAVALLGTIDTDTGALVTALQIMDDWDESDRAKVNLIVGQAGIAAGAGAVGATVPRVTLASDDPAVALLTTIDADTGALAAADLMLGTDFSSVFGTGTLVTTTQADNLADTLDGVNTTTFNYVYDGSTWDRLRGDATNGMLVNLGSNNDVTVTGTVDLGATDNAVLDAIAASLAGTLTVGSHAVTNAGTFAVQVDGAALTALQLIDDVVYVDDADWTDSTSKHVLVGGLYQSTPQTITDGDVGPFQVDANGCLKVAIVSGAGSGGTASADDADFTAGTTSGTPAMGVYESSPTNVTNNDMGIVGITQTRQLRTVAAQEGSWSVDVTGSATTYLSELPLITAAVQAIETAVEGTLTVASHAVTNAGTFAVQVNGDALTALQLIDDVVYVDDADWTDSTSKHVLVGGLYQSTPQTITDGDVGPLQVDANGNLKVNLAAALPAGTNGIGKLTANTGVDIGDVDVTSVIPGTGATNLGKAEDEAHSSGDVGVMMLGVVNTGLETSRVGADGDYCAIAVTTEGAVYVTGGDVQGDVIHDAVDSGAPVKVGHKAIAHGTNPTAVAAADRTNWYANRAGVPFVIGGHPNIISHAVRVLDSDGAQTNVAMVTVSAGTKIVVTRVSVTADGSNTGPVNVTVGFGTSTLTTPNTTTAGSAILADFLGVPAGGGITIGDGSGILGVGADDADLRYTCEDPAGGAITITVSYYTIES